MNVIPYIILFIVIFLSLARADYETEWVKREKGFQEMEKQKAIQQQRKYDSLEAFLQKKERDEERKRQELHKWLEKKYNNRAPAESSEDEDNRKRQAWQQKNSENQRRYVQSVVAREEARQKVLKDFDSKELRRRENKPWR
jgi:hypothetical protein